MITVAKITVSVEDESTVNRGIKLCYDNDDVMNRYQLNDSVLLNSKEPSMKHMTVI